MTDGLPGQFLTVGPDGQKLWVTPPLQPTMQLRLFPADHGDDCLYVGPKWRSGVCDDCDHIEGFKLQQLWKSPSDGFSKWIDVPMAKKDED